MFEFIGSIFQVLIGKPIFNLLVVLIALMPGHNLGAAIIVFTLLVRIALYPLLKKQLHHARALKKLQPDIKRIKKEASGDRLKESQMLRELYTEREINPFGSIGIILVQLPILIALYLAISKILKDPSSIVTDAYGWVQNLPYMQTLATDIGKFDETLFGVVDLTRAAVSSEGFYIPAFILVVLSVVMQYLQSKQLMMTDKNARSLRQIFRDSAAGKEVDQMEVQAATSRLTIYFIPFFLFVISITLASALSLYWFVGALIAYFQQRHILNQDVDEMEAVAESGEPIEAEIVATPTKTKKSKAKKPAKKAKKRRK